MTAEGDQPEVAAPEDARHEIEDLSYALYGLTEEEIAVVEGQDP